MIKFFRKIRQNLLTENKFSKYLLYAVGEIVLIIIGIFFVLQLQSWNEEQKQDAEFEIVLEQFYNAVKNDTEIFNSHKNRIIEQINVIEDLLIKTDSFPREALPNVLGYLTVEDINNYVSESNHHLSNLKYNINNPKQNERLTTFIINCFGKCLFGKFLRNFLWQVFVY